MIAAYVLFFVMLQGCVARRSPKVVNGFNLKISEAPYHVSILENGELTCGGSIVSSHHILTAAHCFEDVTAEELTVRSGSDYAERGGSVTRVSRIISHPQFGIPVYIDNDISVLVLAAKLHFNDNTKAIVLSGLEVEPGDKVLGSGLGRLSFNGPFATTLQGAFFKIIDRELCQRFYEEPITPDKICATDRHQNLCLGDSGGPLVTEMRHLIGISSALQEYCSPPAMFTNVPAYRSFINEATKNSVRWS